MKARIARIAVKIGIGVLIGCGIAIYCLLPMASVKVIHDIPYLAGDSQQSHQLDVYVPEFRTFWEGPRPLIVWIHGGAWRMGNKMATPVSLLPHWGYVAASINYRLTNEAKFPAQLDDVKSAIRYLRQHSTEYGLDPQKIGVWGVSAGGHLAALVGLSADQTSERNTESDTNQTCQNSKEKFAPLQAVCDWCGPTDFITITQQAGNDNKLELKSVDGPVAQLLGGLPSKVPAMAKSASPVTYVRAGAPPFLILHGDADEYVPEQQSIELAKRLSDCGASNTLHVIPGGKHDFTNADLIVESIKFFDKTLKPH